MRNPLVTVIIATFNSEKLLPRVLKSIMKQDYPKNKLEVLFVDGGSTDKTVAIGKKFRCRIVDNPRTEPVYGKYLGYLKARGKYIMYLDHDEVMINKRSISAKIAALEDNVMAKAVAGGGYKSPKGYPFINDYINEFGDPFSFFIYRLSKRNKLFLDSMRKRYPLVLEKKNYALFDLSQVLQLPIIELVAGGSVFDADVLKKQFPETKKKIELLPHYFYLLYSKFPYVIVMKDDPILHYSADTLQKYLKKILWRIKNNIYFASSMGESGFLGRERFQSPLLRLKKYLFILYCYSLVFLIWDSLFLALTRKNVSYMFHLPLSLYTSTAIVFHATLKLLGHRPKMKNYDGTKTIE